MAPTLFMAHTNPTGNTQLAASTEYYYPVGNARFTSTEANLQISFHSAGTLSFFLVSVYTNTINTGTSTARTRINSANGTQSVSIPAGLTGDFEDQTNIDMIADNDKVCYQLVASGASGVIECNIMRCLYSADVDTVTRQACTGVTTYSTASTTRYNIICGNQNNTETTESHTRCRQRKIGTYRNFSVYVSANARTTTSTAKLRKEEADTGITVSIGAGLTGLFEDTTHSTTVAVLDDMNYSLTTGTGTEDLDIRSYQIDYVNTNSTGIYVAGSTDGFSTPQAETKYFPIMGTFAWTSTEADISIRSGFVQADFLELTAKVSQNNVDATSTMTVRKNAADANLTVSIPANTTGTFTDTSDTLDSTYPADEINVKVVTGAGGVTDTVTFINTCIWAFIIPFTGQQSLSMTAPSQSQHRQDQQLGFTSQFQRPIFGA